MGKFKKPLSVISAAFIAASALPLLPTYADDAPMLPTLKDSGIDYTESMETISNPGAGYTSTVWAVCKPGNTPVYDRTGSLMLFFIDIGGFSCGINGTKNEDGTYTEGKDYDLDEAFFKAWDETLSNCRKNGCMAALRFRYDANGKDDPEPATFEQVLKHVQQIGDSGLLEKYADILAYVECGFVGKWGEMHGGKYVSRAHKATLLEAMLNIVPAPVPVTVRTPDIFAEWCGIDRSQLGDRELIDSITESQYSKTIQENKDRVGLFNDGYMGSNSDLGTYANREIETDWLSIQTLTSYYGGEFSGNIDFAKQYDTYLPENAIPEMYKTHLSYINENIFGLYKDYEFGADCDVEGVDNSAYYGENVHKFIRDHLGYRFVLRDSRLTPETVQGGEVKVEFTVENTGFAGVIPSVQSYVLLEKDGVFAYAGADTDCRQWRSCTKTDNSLNIKLPDDLPEGDWNVYLKLSMGTPLSVPSMSSRSIRFANNGVWDGSMCANYLGSVKVDASEKKGTDNGLKATENGDNSPSQFYSVTSGTVVDGVVSSPYEWTEDMLVGEGDRGLKMYVKADDKNLYVMCNVPRNGASAPVYNLQFHNPNDGDRYWIYYASNGFIYYNHGEYSGCRCKWSDEAVEFCLPFETVNLKPDDELPDLRIFLQDSGNDWLLMSDMTADMCAVPSDFGVLSAFTSVRMNIGDSYDYTVLTQLPEGSAKFEWSLNGAVIPQCTTEKMHLESITAEDAGEYSVKITSEGGIEKTVTAFRLNIAENQPDTPSEKILYGDANVDGEVTIADATAILQSIGNPDVFALTPQGVKNADVDGHLGITGVDALTVQMVDAKLINAADLPLKP